MSHSFFAQPTISHFFFRFFLIFLASQLLLSIIPLAPLQEWVAQFIGNALHVATNGALIPIEGGQWFEVTPFCTGITTIALLAGLLFGFAFPPLEKKIKYFVAGSILLFGFNLIRVTLVVYAGMVSQNGTLAEDLHTLTWFIMSGLAMGMWYFVLFRLTHAKSFNELAHKLMQNNTEN